MSAAFGYAFLFLFYSWLYLSVPIWIYWHYRPKPYEPWPTWRRMVIAFGFLGGMTGLLQRGFEAALFFIPASWTVRSGMDSLGEAEYTSLRHDLGMTLAVVASFAFFALLDTTAKVQRENMDLRMRVQQAGEKL